MKKSTKLVMTAAASLLGVALAAGGAYATGGSITVSDAPGQALETTGVYGPAYAHASENAKTHANANAKGLFGTSGEGVVKDKTPKAEDDTDAKTEADVKSNSGVDATVPREAAKTASTEKGQTGVTVKEWAQAKNDVEVVAPDAAVDVTVNAKTEAEVWETEGR
jgi:hypothetical protein